MTSAPIQHEEHVYNFTSKMPNELFYDGEHYYFKVKSEYVERYLKNTKKTIQRKFKLEKLLEK